jgi:hypothetical protein
MRLRYTRPCYNQSVHRSKRHEVSFLRVRK